MKIVQYGKSANLVFKFTMNTENYQKACMMPGFKKWDGYDLIFRPVMANIKYILDNWPAAVWEGPAQEHVDKLRALEADAGRVFQMKTGPLPPLKKDGYQYKRLPREHQRRALLMSWDKPAFALLMEQRTGKTKVIIDNCAYLYKLGRLHTLIIITLNGVHRNWIDNEIPEDLPDWCPREAFFMRPAHTQIQQRQFEKTLKLKDGLRIFSFNVEALSRDGKARDLLEQALGDGKKVMVAVDESSDCIKTYDAKRTKYTLKFAGKAEYRRILTGTQTPEGRPDELFPQYLFLDENILGFDTITPFRQRYCNIVTIDVGNGREVATIKPGCKNVEELRSKIEGVSFRVRRSDCMDLPPKVYKRWPVELSKEQRRLYNELRDEFTTELQGKTLSAAMAMTRALRLQQILCGWFPMDEPELMDGEMWSKVRPIESSGPRIEALQDILRTHEDKCIIWARFRPDLQAIQNLLGPRAVSYHGGINADQKAKNYRAFQNDPSIQYFVANQSSAGRGLTLTKATMEVYYSNSFRLVDRLQSEDRPEGDERKKDSTLVIDIEASGTMDSKVIRALRNKKDMADLINGDPKSIFLE